MKSAAPRKAVRAIGSATTGTVRRGWSRWRRSMMLRVVASTAVVGLGSVAALGAYVSSHIRDGLVETKVDRILAESARDAADAQSKIDASPARTPGDLQKFVNDLVTELHAIGGENRGVILLRQPGGSSQLFSQVSTTPGLQEVLTPQMRAAVQAGVVEQSYQHVYLESLQEPGVVVGAPLSSAVAGNFELYFVYSLHDEQKTLTLIQRILVIGGGALIALVLFMTWSVTLQAVRPVRQAARVASRLAEGLLSERMVVQGRDEMATLATTFNEMAESLQRQITRMEELSRLQRRFVSDVSHELRTPLTTVRMASDVLFDAREDFGPEVARSAELLHAQLDRFEALLSDLLEISRIDAGAAQLEFEDVSLLDIAREELEAIAPVAASAGVQLRLWASPGEHEASMDRPRIARIDRNLASNAIQ